MLVGIERLHFYTPRYYLDLALLAEARGIDPNKYTTGLGQEKMAVLPPDEDIITMAATCAKEALQGIDPNSIALVLLATESGVDQSKAAGIWVHHLLQLSSTCRIVELKQACYSGCAALQLAIPYLQTHPDRKVLILTTDVARYGLQTPGEPTQGAAAAAIVLSTNPKLVAFEPLSGAYTSHVMDFWRPNYRDEALVDGKFSTKVYLEALGHCWTDYQNQTKRTLADHHRFCYHIPFTRMAEKAHERLCKIAGHTEHDPLAVQDSLHYSRKLGNSYTASLFIGLSSLLENSESDLTGKRIGFFSYGSGCVAEFFSGTVLDGYKNSLSRSWHHDMLQDRQGLTLKEYEQFYQFSLPKDGSSFETSRFSTGSFRLAGIKNHERLYEAT